MPIIAIQTLLHYTVYFFLFTSAVPVRNDIEYEEEKETADEKAQAAVATGATIVGVVGLTVVGISIAASVAVTQAAVVLAPATVAASTTAATACGGITGVAGANIGASVTVPMGVSVV
ncbi:hypothetical protein DPMN_154474 [Dreissena polymorpha]|uniref:Uncharacterized protein n=1 Tax=Dreissena polymorpha TaxID=45954 RepID=A0A9D4FQ06_DREPO|nr:hypothetical protein DPMN_154474 [Dreissena polymorpha]